MRYSCVFFFFSSRRRHTRCSRDWSSDVCSSDLDDLARFAHIDPSQTDAKTIHDGVDMVERKFWKELEAIGVTRVDQVGGPFDPNLHEAVTDRKSTRLNSSHGYISYAVFCLKKKHDKRLLDLPILH